MSKINRIHHLEQTSSCLLSATTKREKKKEGRKEGRGGGREETPERCYISLTLCFEY
jgi:hypothetical protein